MFEQLKEHIDAMRRHDPAARSFWEVLLCYPGLHAILLHRVAHALWKAEWKIFGRMISAVTRFLTGIEIHPGAIIGQRLIIDHGMGIVIGETAEIGNDVLMYHGATLGGRSMDRVKRHPTIGDRVVLGAGCKIIGPVHIGADARIGINAVITRDVPGGTVMVAPHAITLAAAARAAAGAAE